MLDSSYSWYVHDVSFRFAPLRVLSPKWASLAVVGLKPGDKDQALSIARNVNAYASAKIPALHSGQT